MGPLTCSLICSPNAGDPLPPCRDRSSANSIGCLSGPPCTLERYTKYQYKMTLTSPASLFSNPVKLTVTAGHNHKDDLQFLKLGSTVTIRGTLVRNSEGIELEMLQMNTNVIKE